jgi:hypothetical protein
MLWANVFDALLAMEPKSEFRVLLVASAIDG